MAGGLTKQPLKIGHGVVITSKRIYMDIITYYQITFVRGI